MSRCAIVFRVLPWSPSSSCACQPVALRRVVRVSSLIDFKAHYCTPPVQQYKVPFIKSQTKMYVAEERGSPYSPDYRVFIKDASGPISAMHDIPLWADREKRILNMLVEVPRWTNAKMEICLAEPLNPIRQDVKKGALRYVANVFPHRGYIWNYGALPQTWENPQHVDPSTQARGDNDPIDVIEIGERVASRGEVIQVKVLGTLALLDEGETDWKLIAIDIRDPLAGSLNDVNDVERLCPGLLRASVEWFRLYKIPDGKPPNEFAFGGEAKDAAFAYRIIDEVHEFWRTMISADGAPSDICRTNVNVEGSPDRIETTEAAAILAKAPSKGLAQPFPSSGKQIPEPQILKVPTHLIIP
ncbi:Inorganic pyrophosphatase [Eumeta japonica]|uniref:Inorganic pyrophosphatase n=1 Tax=Eumeta variegata TaxID=151549 RepID=A0A4C1XKZ8_EUMVA|nr:Inorganic pyrophosphatase [Eumeta japonica]